MASSCPKPFCAKFIVVLIFFRAPLLQALIGVFELPEDESTLPDDHYVEVDDTPGYQAAFSQLAFADKKDHDPLNGIQSSLYSCIMIKY